MYEIVPFSGIQILDFKCDLAKAGARAKRFAIDREGHEERLVPLGSGEDGGDLEQFSEKYTQVVKDLNGCWLPVPVFKVAGQSAGKSTFEPGPTTWARMRLDITASEDDLPTEFNIQIAIDTAIDMNDQSERDGGVYYAPNKSDVEAESHFELVTSIEEMAWFLQATEERPDGDTHDPQEWVTSWLAASMNGNLRPNRQKNVYYWARYLTLIEILGNMEFKCCLANNLSSSAPRTHIDANFVLDLGNSRTCGVLLEKQDGKQSFIQNAINFKVRDFTNSSTADAGLLDSRVELSAANFGFDEIAKRSGRSSAFVWPSPVRIGQEALNLQRKMKNGQGPSGLSSSKRYLWDMSSAPIPWEFNQEQSVAYNTIEQVTRQLVNEKGEFEGDRDMPLLQNTFSRSTFMMFMIAELISQALMQINNPQARQSRPHSGLPRRISKIILTIPTATPAFEQKILRTRAQDAINYVWKILEIPEGFSSFEKPELVIQWDEASCTQQVFLYNEIAERYSGRAKDYFASFGMRRNYNNQEMDSLRITSIDIGGGTTDLMITSYFSDDNDVITPVQEFRESFRVAGDDLLQSLIQTQIIPSLEKHLTELGGKNVPSIITNYFRTHDQEKKTEKSYFANSALKQMAIKIMSEFELNHSSDLRLLFRYDEEFREPEIRNTLNSLARSCGLENWPNRECIVDATQIGFSQIVENTFFRVAENIHSAMAQFPSDYVLLTGRPSKLPHVRRIFSESFAMPPYRLISMHDYEVSEWYPFRNALSGKVGDPKSTVVVGALLNSISRVDLSNYSIKSELLSLRSTANYIGEMDAKSQISSKKIIIDNINRQDDDEFEFIFTNAMYIGSRQVNSEQWVTLPLYSLFLAKQDQDVKLPLNVVVTRTPDAFDADDYFPHSSKEHLKEYIKIVRVEDGEGVSWPPGILDLQFNTLGFQRDYWLESGLFT
ncbi:MAG: virulence factor SrfB [Roseovarius sp.]|nr:virulence factor SrfB [Roseovarius sp.]